MGVWWGVAGVASGGGALLGGGGVGLGAVVGMGVASVVVAAGVMVAGRVAVEMVALAVEGMGLVVVREVAGLRGAVNHQPRTW